MICILLGSFKGNAQNTSAEELYEKAIAFARDHERDSAIHYYTKAAEEFKLNGDLESAHIAQYRIGMNLYYIDEDEKARVLFQKGLEESQRDFGPNSRSKAYYLRGLGVMAEVFQEYEYAIQYYEQVLEVCTSISLTKDEVVAFALSDLGDAYLALEDNWNARKYFKKSLDKRIEIWGADSDKAAGGYRSYAVVLETVGEFHKAATYFQRAIDIQTAIYGADHLALVPTYNMAGGTFVNLKEYQRAYELYSRALSNSSVLQESDRRVAFSVSNLGWVLSKMGRHEEALKFSKRGLGLKHTHMPRWKGSIASSYLNVAASHYHLENWKLARENYLQAIDFANEAFGGNSGYSALGYSFLADISLKNGEYDRAILEAEKSIATNSKQEIDLEEISAESEIYVGNAFTRAVAVLSSAYLNQELDDKSDREKLELVLSLVDANLGRLKEKRSKWTTRKDRRELAEIIHNNHKSGIETAWRLWTYTNEDRFLSKIWEYSEADKAFLLASFVNEHEAAMAANMPDSLQFELRAMQGELDYINSRLEGAPKGSSKEKLLRLKLIVERRRDSINTKIDEEYPRYRTMIASDQSTSILEIQSKLEQNQAMAEFFTNGSQAYAITVTRESKEIYRFEIDSLQQRVEGLRKSIATRSVLLDEQSYDLYRIIFNQADNHLASENISDLIIVPDGYLSHLPFELLKNSNNDYLIETYNISYTPSAALWAKEPRAEGMSSDLLAMAPVFAKGPPVTERGELGKLEGTQQELVSIQEIFNGEFVLGEGASKATFLSNMNGKGIIHLATHAVVDDEYPDLSRLYFSGRDNDEYESLNAYEIYGLQLNAELVTLSACNTGFGKINRGEGVLSLSRAFAFAGAPNTVMSLWPAADKSTATILSDFYANLKMGMSKSESLRQAKLKYLKEADDYGKHPYYWAGFVFQGDPRPIRFENSNKEIFISIAAIVIAVAGIIFGALIMTRAPRRTSVFDLG